LPYFQGTEWHQNPYLDKRYGLDREQFEPVLDAFYRLHGWDTERGWPTAQRLRELGMAGMYADMIDGAARAR
jgi:aldehyde:ferredoxin oxidoreductase